MDDFMLQRSTRCIVNCRRKHVGKTNADSFVLHSKAAVFEAQRWEDWIDKALCDCGKFPNSQTTMKCHYSNSAASGANHAPEWRLTNFLRQPAICSRCGCELYWFSRLENCSDMIVSLVWTWISRIEGVWTFWNVNLDVSEYITIISAM